MKLATERYQAQAQRWPSAGECILGHYDDSTIIVYQAYRPSIGEFAIQHGQLGGPDFSIDRMSWIKPNFLWMMYRSGWGMKKDQEITLGLRVHRGFFDGLLVKAVPSSYDPKRFRSREAWAEAIDSSDVRLQWDPDHSPSGQKLTRRAVQLGLRGEALKQFANTLVEVMDLTEFVALQRPNATDSRLNDLLTPLERVYVPRVLVTPPEVL